MVKLVQPIVHQPLTELATTSVKSEGNYRRKERKFHRWWGESNSTFELNFNSKYHEVRGSMLFTASGMQYFHVFNVSLCGQQPVNCANNITFQAEGEPKSVCVNLGLLIISIKLEVISGMCAGTSINLQDDVDPVAKFGCCRRKQSFVNSVGNTGRPSNWHNQRSPTWRHSRSRWILQFQRFARLLRHTDVQSTLSSLIQLHLKLYFCQFYRATKSCPKGRTTTVTLRCDADQPGAGQVTLPSRCPDGTCDGCHFHFLWSSSTVCPICGTKDIKYVYMKLNY